MLDFLTLNTKAFGLDISDLSLKIVNLKEKRGGLSLASFGETEIKPGVIEKGEIKNEEALAEIIKRALSEIKGEKLATKYVIASLPEEKTFLQVIKMPPMKEEEVKKAVYFEAENYIPLPIEKVYLSSQIVHPLHNHLDHLDVLIAALPKTTVDPYLSSFKKAGLEPLAFEIESQAVSRALIKNEKSPKPLLLIDFGATRSSFIVFSGYSLRFTSSQPISFQKFTEILAKKLKITPKEAEALEALEIKYGIKGTEEGEKIFKILMPNLTNLVDQIKKYLNYYQSHSAHEHLLPQYKKVEKIILCGGGANLKGLDDFLSSELNLPVELGNPWVNILSGPLKEVPGLSYQESLKYTTAFGLALRGQNQKYDD